MEDAQTAEVPAALGKRKQFAPAMVMYTQYAHAASPQHMFWHSPGEDAAMLLSTAVVNW
jgi:hypothetical protein